MNVGQAVYDLTTIAIKNGRIEEEDRIYHQNELLRLIGSNNLGTPEVKTPEELETIVSTLMDAAKRNEMINDKVNLDMMEALIMDTITPLPSQVNHKFWEYYQQQPNAATNYFYHLSQQNNYIKMRSIAKNIHYFAPSPYGELEITINLSKPEKNPKEIAAALKLPQNSYPDCALCIENEGFFGSLNQAARSNHRIINLELSGEKWGFQYSPYAYFNEHAIVLNHIHQPMIVNKKSFEHLADFVEQFPEYMIGSNADLPIVGGSILTHDHYQAGKHDFPMAKAPIREKINLNNFPMVQAGIVDWPMSVIRLKSADREALIEAAEMIRLKWNQYDNIDLLIQASDDQGTRHHTVTPIMRRRGDDFELDLVLRDNNTNDQYPDGIFHPHADVQHIKQENIGLIEVMGLAILPPRLVRELDEVKAFLMNKAEKVNPIHQEWADQLKQHSFTDVDAYVKQAVADVFTRVLSDAGVFKDDAEGHRGFSEFIATFD
ncbi:UDP-glucose--hexose-1-phosphate uridylyltransferase [Weissella koreensis]|uniref:UDP-glucose--hexose-1-phosphate uridylyltransferase n=1 Tax=Weissella koreensis TaxID=165096 RepID=UPI0022BA2ADE|nr:UDP-glucose--hexose-1-phosphate uridylyltransferase [Weissella koreensis]MCZ9310588.1 UDP-glucose--hexose-1-phosphate uridylyltransferase [Weissella koreensis]